MTLNKFTVYFRTGTSNRADGSSGEKGGGDRKDLALIKHQLYASSLLFMAVNACNYTPRWVSLYPLYKREKAGNRRAIIHVVTVLGMILSALLILANLILTVIL